MNKSDRFFLDTFYKNFKAFLEDGTPIALYGIGEKTKLLLENIEGFNIIGLMDKDSVGTHIYGLPVLSHQDVVKTAKCIIIVANMSVAPLIYQRISTLKKGWGIDIFYTNGTKPVDTYEPRPHRKNSASNVDLLKKAIDQNEVISFDLFDTLIMRRVLTPTDIFDIVERELREKLDLQIDFKNKRIEAELYTFRHLNKYCNIDDIYKTLQTLLLIDENLAQTIQQIEFEAELSYCVPRSVIVQCFEYANQQQKTVLITTDTFLKKEQIRHLLQKCGIDGYDKLLISCEEKKLKYLGDMWQYVAQLFETRRILHIGDNIKTDVEIPQQLGINTFKIDSAFDLLFTVPPLSQLYKPEIAIHDKALLGQLSTNYLNDPWVIDINNSRLPISDAFSLGYWSFGPLVLNYLLWLIRQSTENKVDKLLFFARDGYILQKLFQKITNHYKIDSAKTIYFLTSRRAASVPTIKDEKDIVFIINKMCKIKTMSIRQILFTTFGLLAAKNDPVASKLYMGLTEDELIRHIIDHYSGKILKRAAIERQNYLTYIETLELTDVDSIGYVNFVGRGITQKFVSRILQRNLTGYYFAKEVEMLDICQSEDRCYALYRDYISLHTSTKHLATKFGFGEVIFSSPDEQLVCFDNTGQPIFDQPRTKRKFDDIAACHAGIEQLVEDMMFMDDQLLSRRFDEYVVDELYGFFTNPYCDCAEDVKQIFSFNDYYNPNVSDLGLQLR